jgi:hypothetical protein
VWKTLWVQPTDHISVCDQQIRCVSIQDCDSFMLHATIQINMKVKFVAIYLAYNIIHSVRLYRMCSYIIAMRCLIQLRVVYTITTIQINMKVKFSFLFIKNSINKNEKLQL